MISQADTHISKKISFVGAYGFNLLANLELPLASPPKAFALFAHCFTCSKDTIAAARISKALTKFGIAVLRFDFTGLGGSEGDFANTNFSGNVKDLLSAVAFLRENYAAPQLLIGHSLGGAAVLAAAAHVPEAKALVTIGAPSTTTHLERLLKEKLSDIKANGEAEVNLDGRKFHIQKQFLDDLGKHKLLDTVSTLHQPLLIFHSPEDTIVNVENAFELFSAANQPKSFISLDGANHLLTRREDAHYVADVLMAWVSRYIHLPAAADQPETRALTPQVVVKELQAGKFVQEVQVGRHVLIADEPTSVGGSDLGPSPYDFLLIALGACTSMTLRLYADLKKIPLERTIVQLNHHKIHEQDCENCENEKAKIDKIERSIELQGELTPQQKEKLLEIADKCPVHRTLSSKIIINTVLVK